MLSASALPIIGSACCNLWMLTGKELGDALARAMATKQVNQPAVAKEFGVQQPSVSEWIRFGRIAKKHIPHLVEYFSDVVGPEHWGLPPTWTASHWPLPMVDCGRYQKLDAADQAYAQAKMMAAIEEREAKASGKVAPLPVPSPAGSQQIPAPARRGRPAPEPQYLGDISLLKAGKSAAEVPHGSRRKNR